MSLTPEQRKLEAQRVIAQRVLARRRLLQFTKLTHPSYSAGWVHEDICRRLEKFSQDVVDKKSPRLMLLMPPRHGKSELASIRFPAWHLGQHPHHEVINVGYNLDLPMVFSRKVREIFRDPLFQAIFPGVALDPDSQGAEKWNTTAGGGFLAAGAAGGLTGKGAHVLIIDDPLKNQEEADKAEHRDKLTDWYESVAYTRLAPGGGVLLIETWWNDDDLAGRLQARMREPEADQFEVVKYPALSEAWEYRDEDTYHIVRSPEALDLTERNLTLLRPIDTCLHEARYPTEAVKRIRANLQPRIWSALYQQNPVPDEGMYFKKEDFVLHPAPPDPRDCRIYTAWDFAIGEKQQNDWTVGATIAQDSEDYLWVLEIVRFKGDTFQIIEGILDTAVRWSGRPGCDYLIGAEDGQIWRTLEPMLKKRMAERRQYPSYEVLRPFTDKLVRARPLQGRMQQNRVIFPKDASWLDTARQEMLRFPAGAHDDVVDALAWAAHLVMGKEPPRAHLPRPLPSWKDKLNELGLYGVDGSHMTA
jgi:predicted phage terminase large subunit-like protein